MQLPPLEFFHEVGAAGVASGLVLFLLWPWRRAAWPGAVAVGAGFLTTVLLAFVGWGRERWTDPDNWAWLEWNPPDATRLAPHLAVGGAVLGVVLSLKRVPELVRWILPLAASAGLVWLVLGDWAPHRWPDDKERALWLGGLAGGLFVVWKLYDGTTRRSPGFAAPLMLMLAAGAAGHAVGQWGGSGLLGQYAGALAAALAPCVLFGLILKDKTLGEGAVAVTAMLLGFVLLCSVYFAQLPDWSAALLAVAPGAVLFRKPRWLGPALFAAIVGAALAWSWRAAQPEDDGGEPDPYEQYR